MKWLSTNTRHRKCDEAKPFCNNCASAKRTCEGYQKRFVFEVTSLANPQKRKRRLLGQGQKAEVLGQENVVTAQIAPAQETPVTPTLVGDATDDLGLASTKGPQLPLSQVLEQFFPNDVSAKDTFDLALEDFTSDVPTPGATTFEHELLLLIGKSSVFDSETAPASPAASALSFSHQEENMMLKHFFQRLLPLLDAHPRSPWPQLALRYCDFDVARSCFISLACIHIYESREGGNEFYKRGMAHINQTMSHLIQHISKSAAEPPFLGAVRSQIQSFVTLVLVNVHILFAVLDKGQSSLARYLFRVFGAICLDPAVFASLRQDENKTSLVVVLSWYDTVAAIVSPDCRLPFCKPDWFGTRNDVISTVHMMGCPGEIFRALYEVCTLRHEIHQQRLSDGPEFAAAFQKVKLQLATYRDYVVLGDSTKSEDYVLRLKAAQCWSLAVYILLLRLFRTTQRQQAIQSAVLEFIDTYGSMPSASPVVTQMVWPVYAVGCECRTDFERQSLGRYMGTLYKTAQMGTLASLQWVVEQVWRRGSTQEQVLAMWLADGVDYLPL